MESTGKKPARNEIAQRFLAEAVALLDREETKVMSKQEIFERIDLPLDLDVIGYMTKLDFIREETASSFSLTDRGLQMGRRAGG